MPKRKAIELADPSVPDSGPGGPEAGPGEPVPDEDVIQGLLEKISPAKNWCFTWHNYPDDWQSVLSGLTKLSGWCVGQEICPETQRPHLQGWVQFKAKGRPFNLGLPRKVWWRKCRGSPQQNYAYCTKDGQATVDGTCKGFRPYTVDLPEVRPWQKEILAILHTTPDDRSIYWIWEDTGGIGKTTFCKHITTTYPKLRTLALEGKAADMKNGIVEYHDSMHQYPGVILGNIPRSYKQEWISYHGLEQVKDMYFYSGKFKGGMVCGPNPHLMIFANMPPERTQMSADRWKIYKIIDQVLVRDD